MKKLFIFVLFIISLNSCENKKKLPYDIEQEKMMVGIYYENLIAAEFNEIGIELTKNGNLNKAEESFLKALKLEPNNPTTLSNLGLNSYLTNDYKNAIKYYQKSYKISDSTYHIAAVNMGLTYYQNQEYDKGIELTSYVIEHAVDMEILCSAYIHRALNNFGNKKCNKARADFNYILNNFQEIENIEYQIIILEAQIITCVQDSI